MPTIDALDAMNATDDVPHETRRAALTLHALAPWDRAWLLEHLPSARRAQLDALLAELSELGIPPDEHLVRDALAVAPASAPAADDARDAWKTLARLPADTMVALLQDEPAGLVARLLALRAWPWAEALVQSLDAARLRCVEDSANNAWPGGTTVDAWLVADLARRAAESVVAPLVLEGDRR